MKLIDGLSIINAGRAGLPQPFSIEFYKFNDAKRTGGQVVILEKQVGTKSRHNPFENGTVTVRNANNTGHPTTIHIRLIKSINGERVFW
jgi:hypothetical protein